MTTYVRVELENGSKASIPESVAARAGEKIKVLEGEEALDHRGRPKAIEFPDEPAAVPPGQDPVQTYAGMSAEDLRAEIDRRNDGREDGNKLSKGSKADMADLLTADDTAQGV